MIGSATGVCRIVTSRLVTALLAIFQTMRGSTLASVAQKVAIDNEVFLGTVSSRLT
jgi:hypothetical protein